MYNGVKGNENTYLYLGTVCSSSIIYIIFFREALEFTQNRRYCINPNDGFKQQLMEYEMIYKAQNTLLSGQCSQNNSRLKRKHHEDSDLDTSEPMEAIS